MAAVDSAWKHTRLTAGNEQGRTPASFGETPTTMMAAGTLYSAGDLTDVSTDDDLTWTDTNIAVAPTTTGRANHLFRFEGVAEGTIAPFSFFVRYTHLISGNHLVHQHRWYIWNDTNSVWEQMNARTNANDPRSMNGIPASTPLGEYVNGAGEVFLTLWDFEGVFQTGGACIHADTLVTLEGDLQVKARDVRFGDYMMGPDGPIKVDETTYHFPALTKMVRVTAGLPTGPVNPPRPTRPAPPPAPAYVVPRPRREPNPLGTPKDPSPQPTLSYYVSDVHMCPVEDGWKRAADLKLGDRIPTTDGRLRPITKIEAIEEVCEVIDINVTDPLGLVATYEIGGGLLTCNMAVLG